MPELTRIIEIKAKAGASVPDILISDSDYLGSIPCVKTSKITPGVINGGGLNPNQSALGSRSVLSISCTDFEPSEAGVISFWGTYISRNPYHKGSVVTVYDGNTSQ